MLAAVLLAACSNDTPDTSAEAQEIRFNADVWQMMDGTRATTISSNTDLEAMGSFTCYAYVDGSTDKYIDGSTVSFSASTTPNWIFTDGKHYWPATGSLNFFAFMPAADTYWTFDSTPYDAGSNPDGYSEDSPRIVCTDLPVNITAGSDKPQELILAYAASQDKNGSNTSLQPTPGQVALNFMHPFARIFLKLSPESGSGVSVNRVTIAGVKNKGTATFDGTTTTWTPSGDATNFVVSGVPASGSTPAVPATGDTPYLVIPQTFAANLTFTVNATWTDWSNVTKDISASVNVGEWQPGHSYTYTLTLNKEALIVETEKYTEQW